MFEMLRGELDAALERDPAARGRLEVLLLYPGVHALLLYRAAHRLYARSSFLGRALSQLARSLTGIEIHPAAKLGRGVFIDHGAGVVIGETAELGDGCTLYHGATLGGTGKERGKRHPTLGRNVTVGCGARILGPVTIGDDARIAANAVVLCDVPAHTTFAGIPARMVRSRAPDSDACPEGLGCGRCPALSAEPAHGEAPERIAALLGRIDALEARLAALESGELIGLDSAESCRGGVASES